MMDFINNEIFGGVIDSEYRSSEGKIIKNVYTTKDDSALLVGTWTFEKLLAGSKDISVEDFYKEHKEELRALVLADEPTVEEKRDAALQKANDAVKRKGNITRAKILKGILEGSTKAVIADNLCTSISTVTSAISGLTKEDYIALFDDFKEDILKDTDSSLFEAFKTADCSYASYRTYLKENHPELIQLNSKRNLSNVTSLLDDEKQVSNPVVREDEHKIYLANGKEIIKVPHAEAKSQKELDEEEAIERMLNAQARYEREYGSREAFSVGAKRRVARPKQGTVIPATYHEEVYAVIEDETNEWGE